MDKEYINNLKEALKSMDKCDITSVLDMAQAKLSHIPECVLPLISEVTGVDIGQIKSIINFNCCYSNKPSNKPKVKICTGHSCSARGSLKIMLALKKEFFQDVDIARCFGNCANAPVIKIDGKMHEKLTVDKAVKLVNGDSSSN